MGSDKTEPTEPLYDGAAFAAISPGPTRIVLAGMFHEKPELLEASKTVEDWEKALAAFLAATA